MTKDNLKWSVHVEYEGSLHVGGYAEDSTPQRLFGYISIKGGADDAPLWLSPRLPTGVLEPLVTELVGLCNLHNRELELVLALLSP